MRPLAHAVLCLLELAHAGRGLLLAADSQRPPPSSTRTGCGHTVRTTVELPAGRPAGEKTSHFQRPPHAQIELAGRRLVSLLACGVSVRHAGADESRRWLQDVCREIKDSENLCVRENY